MRVLLADDHALVRAGIASLLRAFGFHVVGEASDGSEAIELARKLRPDLILMDITMPRCSGLEATRVIKSELAETKIVMVTVSDHDSDLFEAIKSGADGYLLKDMSSEEFGRMLGGLAEGHLPLASSLALKIIDEFGRRARGETAGSDRTGLTPREQEVLELIAAGSTNREIAAALHIAESTVHFHVKNILAKLHLKNRSQAAAYAVGRRLVEAPRPNG
ncbi:MAG: response regulator transcription factor [Gaiellaceae bacterium]